jgi:hypothetical protein
MRQKGDLDSRSLVHGGAGAACRRDSDCFRGCCSCKVFPTQWRLANVAPVPATGPLTFRPGIPTGVFAKDPTEPPIPKVNGGGAMEP